LIECNLSVKIQSQFSEDEGSTHPTLELISAVDAKIVEAITEEEEIGAEILQSEEITYSISSDRAKITRRLISTDPTTAITWSTKAHMSTTYCGCIF